MENHQPNEFNDSIAKKYHWFFSSWQDVMNVQMQELVPLFRKYNVVDILDCSCGTGLQAIGLAKAGFNVIGSDLSEKMLEVAKENALNEGLSGIQFLQADFREIRSKVHGEYDAVISLGNSIPHLMNDSDILLAFTNIYDCLKSGGIAVFDIRNYDEMIARKQRFLPMRIHERKDGKTVSVLYVLDYLNDIIRFNIVYLIEDKDTGNKSMEVEIVDYNPIKSASFVELLKKAGFIEIEKKEMGPNIHFTAIKP